MITEVKFHETVDPLVDILGHGWSLNDVHPVGDEGWVFRIEWLPDDESEIYRVAVNPSVTFSPDEDEDEQVSDLHLTTMASIGACFLAHAKRKRELVL